MELERTTVEDGVHQIQWEVGQQAETWFALADLIEENGVPLPAGHEEAFRRVGLRLAVFSEDRRTPTGLTARAMVGLAWLAGDLWPRCVSVWSALRTYWSALHVNGPGFADQDRWRYVVKCSAWFKTEKIKAAAADNGWDLASVLQCMDALANCEWRDE